MKHALIFVVAVVLTAGVVWAEESVAEAAFLDELAPVDSATEGGGCVLPDFSGMSEEEIREAALAAGLVPTQAAVAACPTTFNCSSITNCGAGPVCSVTDIGQCCTTGGIGFCCPFGQTIKVRRCPCRCTGNPCLVTCPNNTDVSSRCS